MVAVDIVEAIMVAAMVVVDIVEAIMVAAMVAVDILNLILLIRTNRQEQMVGKIEVMEILLKTLNMKVVEVEEREAFQTRIMYKVRRVNIPFLQVWKLT
jgi:hypothetical protein